MSATVKVIQYKPRDQKVPEAYVIIKCGKYQYYTGIGNVTESGHLNFQDSFTIRLDKFMILEVELWDYWASTDMMLAKGIIDIRHIIKEKKDLVPISLRKSSQIQGDLLIHLLLDDIPQLKEQSSFNTASHQVSSQTSSFNDIFLQGQKLLEQYQQSKSMNQQQQVYSKGSPYHNMPQKNNR